MPDELLNVPHQNYYGFTKKDKLLFLVMKARNSGWRVRITSEAAEAFKTNELTDDDKLVIRKWAQTIFEHSPEELQRAPSIWADPPLYGKWKGHRSSSFSYRGRIIYRVEKKVVTVVVVKITTKHDYKKD